MKRIKVFISTYKVFRFFFCVSQASETSAGDTREKRSLSRARAFHVLKKTRKKCMMLKGTDFS